MEIMGKYFYPVLAGLLIFVFFGAWCLWVGRKGGKSRRKQITSAVSQREPSFGPPIGLRGKGKQPDGPSLLPRSPPSGADPGQESLAEMAAEAETGFAPETPEGELQGEAGALDSEDSRWFPDLVTEQINEKFYFCARLTGPQGGFHGKDIRNMSAEIVREAQLHRHQLILGHVEDRGKWVPLHTDARYGHVVWAVTLRDRKTSICEAEHSCIVKLIMRCMKRTGGFAELPPFEALDRAQKQIGELFAAVNVEISVLFVAVASNGGGVRTCENIIDIARGHGMEEIGGQLLRRENGEQLFILRGGDGKSLSTKSPDRGIARLELVLDLPLVTQPRRTCAELFEFAKKIERIFSYRMVDENENRIDDVYIKNCLHEVDYMSQSLVKAGIRPGSKLSRALFC